jgi:hypothetical protein
MDLCIFTEITSKCKLCFHMLNKILKSQETRMFVQKYIVIAYGRLKKNKSNVTLL